MNCLVCLMVIVFTALVEMSVSVGQKPAVIADKIEQIGPSITSGRGSNQEFPARSPFLDILLNIPIQTLRAVNELVQSIAGNFQTAGGQNRPERNSKLRHPEKHSREMDGDEQA